MLTDSELAWLEIRLHHDSPFCIGCERLNVDDDGVAWCMPQACPLELKVDDVLEAAEFSERVAAKLAKHDFWEPCKHGCSYVCPVHTSLSCGWCHMMWARCEVEEEMDAD